MKIVVISDTHGVLREEVITYLKSCDAVIHAGDMDTQAVYDQIVAEKPENASFYVVRGNNDWGWALRMSKQLTFTLAGKQFFMVHDQNHIPANLNDVQIVIYGHSHQFHFEEKDGRLWLNPGSCGRPRFRLPLTMAVLTIEDGKCSVERIEISTQSPDKGKNPDNDQKSDKKAKNKAGLKAADMDELLKMNDGSLLCIIEEILRRMKKGQSIAKISKKLGIEEEFTAQICRIYVTHPGVDANGILNKIEVNRIVSR